LLNYTNYIINNVNNYNLIVFLNKKKAYYFL
jgi:hypothetical protein